MNAGKRYENAPITEAVISIQVELADERQIHHLADFEKQVKPDYSKYGVQNRSKAHIEIGEETSSKVSSREIGILFKSQDEKFVVQCRVDGFALSRLRPYSDWITFRDEAKHLWHVYQETCAPKTITRLAVRYINRIDIPGNKAELAEYFLTTPQVSPALSQPLSGFFMRLQMPHDDLNAIAIINQTLVPPAHHDVISIVLDVDLACDENVPQTDIEMWEYLDLLRDRKNHIFENCLTDKAKELFT